MICKRDQHYCSRDMLVILTQVHFYIDYKRKDSRSKNYTRPKWITCKKKNDFVKKKNVKKIDHSTLTNNDHSIKFQ